MALMLGSGSAIPPSCGNASVIRIFLDTSDSIACAPAAEVLARTLV